MTLYKSWNAPMATTAAQGVVTTGTAIKTMLQIATPSTRQLKVVSWGYSIGGAPTNGLVELLETDVAATVTAHSASGVMPLTPGAPASLMTLGTTATGFTATAEGSITATRVFDANRGHAADNGNQLTYNYQFMPDERPIVAVSKFLRVRVTFGSAQNMICWIVWSEE